MDATRNLIDYAMDSNGVEFRNQLYASIHDRVTAAIEAKKQEIAGNLIRQEAKEEKEEGAGHEKAEKKMMKSLDKNGDGKHTMADHQKEEVEELDEADEEKDEKSEKEEPKKPNAFTMRSKTPSEFAKSSSGGKTKETKTGRTHSSGDRY